MPGTSAVRVLMYSHDTFGLGHLTRTLRVARALRGRTERVSILILTGSPVAPYMALPPGADLVKLPSVVKVGRERYRSRDLEINFSQIKKMRVRMIRSTMLSFRPHLFLVDNVPLGMKKEILPTLRLVRESLPDVRTVLILRDILDAPEVIRENWDRDGVPAVLHDLYDRIFVLGDAALFDAVRAYGLPEEKTMHVGYGAPAGRLSLPMEEDRTGLPRVLFTAGGGGDGLEFLSAGLEGLEQEVDRGDRGRAGIELEVVTGPLMEPEGRRLLHERASACGARLHEFVPDLPERMAKVDLVVAMAGYNTCCEILACARSALLLPRVAPRVEQLLRCQVLEKRGLISFIRPENQSPEDIRAAVLRTLERGPRIREEDLPRIDGLAALARELEDLLPRTAKRAQAEGALGVGAGGLGVGAGGVGEAPGRNGAGRNGPGRSGPGRNGRRRNVWYWPGGTALILLLLLGPGAALAAKGGASWGGVLALGWDRNLLQSSFAEERAFGTSNPDYWFEIDRLDDARALAGIWGQWEVRSFTKTLRVKAEYRRTQVEHNPILGTDEYALSLRQKLPRSAHLDFSATVSPQVYLRHRVDKNAGPGELRFRPEAYRGVEYQLGYTRPLVQVPVTVYGVYEGRKETRWFRDRDRRTFGGGLTLAIPAGGLTWKPLYEFDRTRSRRSSRSDYSNREHAAGLEILAPVPVPWGPWAADASGRWKFRKYTTSNPNESTRYHRKDRTWWWNLYVRRPFGHVTPFAGYESSGRRLSLPSGATAADEEGEYDSSLVQAGLEWGF